MSLPCRPSETGPNPADAMMLVPFPLRRLLALVCFLSLLGLGAMRRRITGDNVAAGPPV